MLELLAKNVFKFDTAKSYKYFLDCKDNHKAWQAFETLLHGTVMELIHVYCSETTLVSLPTPLGFLQWQSSITKPTLKLVSCIMLNLCLGVYIQRIGDRNNDKKCSDAGRMKCMDMFFGFNHPLYREIEYNELRNKVLFPRDVEMVRDCNITFSDNSSDLRTAHQGGDFKLEEKVKSMKRMSPKGVVSTDMWLRVARIHDDVSEAVANTMTILNVNESTRIRLTNLRKELNLWRAILRNSSFLRANTDRAVNINGVYLDQCMDDLMGEMKVKRHHYFEETLQTNLENIRYENLRVVSSDIMDEIDPFIAFLDDDYDWEALQS